MARYLCDWCKELREIVAFIPDGKVPGIINMDRYRPACQECMARPAIDGKPSEKEEWL